MTRSAETPVLPPPADGGAPQAAARAALEVIARVREDVEHDAERLLQSWRAAIALPAYRASALNLARYLALRRHDLSDLQPALSALGLSSLGRCEGHVMANIDAVVAALTRICGVEPQPFPPAELWGEGERRLAEQGRALFARDDGATAIMVTLPSEAASDPALVASYVAAGMNCARINCAHDDAQAWAAMVRHVGQAAKTFGRPCKILMDMPGPKCRVETLRPKKPERLQVGDRFRLAVSTDQANDSDMPVVTISFPDVVARLPLEAQVWIDDGKIRGRVVGVEGADRIVEVVGARAKGERIKLEKGVNFPGTPLDLPALSADDLAALPAIAKHADMVGFSFVQRPRDIVDLDRAIEAVKPGGAPMPLVLKIETPEAVRNLPSLIVQAAGTRSAAVMIARGDLAVELGHIRMAEIQEEILWLCEAARIPVVWATQVLDDLVKEGLPSRAETTDAAMAQRAECVMLNKGPHVVEAIRFLSDVAGKMSRHQTKKYPLLGALHSWPLDALPVEEPRRAEIVRPKAVSSKKKSSPHAPPAS